MYDIRWDHTLNFTERAPEHHLLTQQRVWSWFEVLVSGLRHGLGALAVGLIALRQIGGYTGDVLGAGQAIAETAALVAASAVISGNMS